MILKKRKHAIVESAVREGLGKVGGDRGVKGDDAQVLSFDNDLSNADDDGESASEKAKQRVRESSRRKTTKRTIKRNKKEM